MKVNIGEEKFRVVYTSIANMFSTFSLSCYIFGLETVILKPKLVLLFYQHAYATTKYLR